MAEVRVEHPEGEKTCQKLFLLLLRGFIVETTGLNNLVVDIELESRARVHRLLNALVSDESKDADCLGLSDTMRTILSLQISMRIPIGIEAIKGDFEPVCSRGTVRKSYIMTVSAVCRLRPSPPALVDKMKTMYSEFGALNIWT